MVFNNIIDTIGRTPLVKIKSLSNNKVSVFGKLEYFNPSGSVKDRAALYMINDALLRGEINLKTVIIEPTSGNTGIGLAMVCASLGLRLILTMPENMSIERIKILKAYGAEVVLTDKEKGMSGAINKAYELVKEYGNAYIPSQFTNSSNSNAHFMTTAPEIYSDIKDVSWLIAGVGSGGTLMGLKRYVDLNKYSTKVCAVEPLSSPMLSKGYAGMHKIQGIGANFIPEIVDVNKIDRIESIGDNESMQCARELAKNEGIFVGISSGAVVQAAKNLISSGEIGNIVMILPDSGMKYLSTELIDG